ncbi:MULTISPECIES: cupin domain-containing protein [unclassified Roseateles]|uniref:cupin domain-containing protein n=1 Tax=unclassified Roseateles TaxID=2626991 RepID=UPI0006FA058D|nr:MULTISPECIES: cupin domain-containing protein [unclassified Roseateles]KQW44876.1 cupin [Pelomonas sp. Root405]KRA70235.1 cupin [Pelomonas sp. Root662]
MTKLIRDITRLGPRVGDHAKLDYGMDEDDWCALRGTASGYTVGWWEGRVGAVDFPATTADEIVWLAEGHIALTDEAGGRIEFRGGDSYRLPAGFAGRWETLADARKFYVLLDPA